MELVIYQQIHTVLLVVNDLVETRKINEMEFLIETIININNTQSISYNNCFTHMINHVLWE